MSRLRKTFYLFTWNQIHHQRQRRASDGGKGNNSDATHFDLAGYRIWACRDKGIVLAGQNGLIIGDEPTARFNDTQREIGFSATRWAAEKHGFAIDRDTGPVNTFHGALLALAEGFVNW